jgi:hypothetical protein
VTTGKAQGVEVGTATGFAEGTVNGPGQCACNPRIVEVSVPIYVAPTILLGGSGGTNITNTTQSVVVGQQIVLYASYALPSGVTVSSQSWSVPGTIVAGYTGSPSSGSVSTSVTLNQQSTMFYWVYAGSSLQVTFKLTLSDGTSPSATATFNVAGATVSKMSTPTGSVGIYAGPVLGYGPVGIKFSPTPTTPSADSGQFEWVQLITTTTGGTVKTCINVTQPPTSSGTGLDTDYPFATGTSTQDSPSLSLVSSSYSQEARSFSANMYLLWNPALPSGCTPGSSCTSIPVPLESVSWGWSGTASYSAGNWSRTSSSQTTPSWVAGTSYPIWSDLVL